jgi:hypothetical protein
LNQYDHADPPVFNRPNRERDPNGYRPRPPLKNKQTQRTQQQQKPFQTTSRQCHQNLQKHQKHQQQQRKLLQPINFVPGPVLHPPPAMTPCTSVQPQIYGPQSNQHSTSSSSLSSNQSLSFSVPIEVHRPQTSLNIPAATVSQANPANINRSSTPPQRNNFEVQPATSFMDPLIPAVVKTTQISAAENGRYALSRLHEANLMRTVRAYIVYLNEYPNACHEGLTAAHCGTIIGSKGLPTDVVPLKNLYFQYSIQFGNLTEQEVIAELASYKNYLASNTINYLQKTREATSKFYTNRKQSAYRNPPLFRQPTSKSRYR